MPASARLQLTKKLEMKMTSGMQRGLFLSAAVLALAGVFDCVTSSSAQSYPVCLNGGSDNSMRCDFSSMQQCRATASGGLGYCEQNPLSANAKATYLGIGDGLFYRRSGVTNAPVHHG